MIILIILIIGLAVALVAVGALAVSQQRTMERNKRAVTPPDPTLVSEAEEFRRLSAALDSIGLGLLIADSSGELIYETGTAEQLLRSTDSLALVRQAAIELIEGFGSGGAKKREVDLFGPPKATYLVRALPLNVGGDTNGRGTVVVIEDISERRRTDQVRRDFVTNISHELKTPVGALGLLAETLEGETDPATVARFTSRISTEVHRLGHTIDDLLELSRIEFGDDLKFADHRIGAIVGGATDRLRSAAAANDIELAIVGDPELVVHVDDRQVTSALSNLIDNAIKYSQPSSTVTVAMEREGGRVVVSVADEGDGIPTRDLDRVFERFYRVDRARSRGTGGTGLGLAIVRHVANNHGTTVRVQSKEGHGSTFSIALPTHPLSSAQLTHVADTANEVPQTNNEATP
ncbi:MAG: GHKL domain-containing protein [Actinobacteria bacterium]|nr:GHKL domain-containing protein [Actinomycetota bacterium]